MVEVQSRGEHGQQNIIIQKPAIPNGEYQISIDKVIDPKHFQKVATIL